ncbi:TLD-domain-containing protein [Sporodiniella umbellata]|nr:TLD-domain-containing protein [Sporodiniella umbellata]
MPIIETVKETPQISPIGADFPYASVTLHLSNRYPQTRPCLDIHLAQNLRMALPPRVAILSNWSLIYSLDQHGASQSTLYQQCKQNSGPCLLVIQDSQFETFGAYLTESFHNDTGYYGTGECFLWKLDSQTEKANVYPWTMKNDYLVYSDRSSLAVGGSRFGLWIDSDLAHGYTEPSETFDNPPLTLKNSFECIGLEIWGFQY